MFYKPSMNKQLSICKNNTFKISSFFNQFFDFKKNEQLKGQPNRINDEIVEVPEEAIFISKNWLFTRDNEQSKRAILLVEDNQEVRECIKSSLESKYFVYEAVNGIEGLKIANEHLPDLIISDVTMPEMDGLEFCNKIKTYEYTSSIPVILLTGNIGLAHQMSCLKNGADVYLTKPFNVQALMLNVENLLSLSDKMQKRFSKQISLELSHIAIDNKGEEFISKVLHLVEKNISNTDFGVHHLAAEVGMSSPVFYKKLQVLTGMSVNNFMKSIKLKRAAQLLKQGSLTVYQVAYEVGFKDSKYFSREFRKQFGYSPSNYYPS
jgi:YesN/AraC family two-component response regulator